MIDYARKIKLIIPDFDETLINASFQAARIDSMDLLTIRVEFENLNGQAFGRVLGPNDFQNGKYYVNYSFVVPNQLDNSYNAENMHVLIYVYDKTTLEIYQVIKKKIIP